MITDRITIVLTSATEFVPVASVIEVIESATGILHDVGSNISQRSGGALEWQIAEISMASPLRIAMFAEDEEDPALPAETVRATTRGLRQIEESPDARPAFFDAGTLEKAKRLVSVLNNGVTRITIADPWTEPVIPSQRLAANVDELLPKEHEEIGSCEGRIESLSIHGRTTFGIWDAVTGRAVECRFPQELYQEAYSLFGQRVLVTGLVRYSRAGGPKVVRVESIRRLRSQSELPQARDLEGIDITGGLDPAEYVRRNRDASAARVLGE
jgi:hypothetical protein